MSNELNSAPLNRESWLNRIRYRSWHRGCKETDLILGGYCNHHLLELDDATLHLFEQLLDEDDAEIWSWITGKTTPQNSTYAPLISALQAFEFYTHTQSQ
jgi:antitoxin CptB